MGYNKSSNKVHTKYILVIFVLSVAMKSYLTGPFQFSEYVSEDGIAVELRRYAHEMPIGVMAPGYLIGEYGAVYQLGGDPVWVDKVSGC